MERVSLIRLEWNIYNGVMFNILNINDRSLLGISFGWKSYLYIDLLWFKIELNNSWENRNL